MSRETDQGFKHLPEGTLDQFERLQNPDQRVYGIVDKQRGRFYYALPPLVDLQSLDGFIAMLDFALGEHKRPGSAVKEAVSEFTLTTYTDLGGDGSCDLLITWEKESDQEARDKAVSVFKGKYKEYREHCPAPVRKMPELPLGWEGPLSGGPEPEVFKAFKDQNKK